MMSGADRNSSKKLARSGTMAPNKKGHGKMDQI